MRPFPLSRLAAAALACALLPAAAAAAPFSVQAVFPFGPAHVGVAFSDSVDVAGALLASHYTLTPGGGAPALVIQSVQLQDNQRTVILQTTAALPRAAAYALSVSGITSRHGEALAFAGPAAFTTPATAITGIADVHANINALIGQSVTVLGEVYMRAGSVTGTPSGYVQDGTGFGLNVFGSPLQPPLDTLGTVVQVTGTAALYFTTIELTNLSVVPVASNVPRLAPRVLSVAGAASAEWEGTYIQATALLTGPPTASGSNHMNYPATGDGLPFSFRVRNSMGVDPSGFAGNELVTGAGAGSYFQGAYQITAGVPGDFWKGVGRGDLTPPVLGSAAGEGGDTHVSVAFSEPVAAGAATAANYVLHPAGSPGAPIAVTAASPTGATVMLTLAAPLVAGAAYTLAVSHVQDAAGNEIPAGATLAFTAATPVPYGVAGVFRFGAAYVGVAFTRPVNATAATRTANYAFTPALALADARLQANGQTVILRAAVALPASTTYHVTVSGVPGATGEPLPAGGLYAFDTGAEAVTDIADVQADVSRFSGQTVTLAGQVTIPVGSRGGTPSGYLEDGSGHGINLYGGAIQGIVNQLGGVAKVTGTVTPYFTTTEFTGYTATALATGMPHLAARRLTLLQANDPQWEGTYIETSGTLNEISASGTSNTNYVAAEANSSITFRIANGLGIPPGQFVVGDRVTGRGAGGSFQGSFQILVGGVQDFQLAGAAGPDTTGPRVVSAGGDDGSPRVVVGFDEPLGPATATLAANYTLTPAGGAAIPVTQAVLAAGGRSVTLTLASPLSGGASYTLAVTGVADLAGNPVLPGAGIAFTATLAAPTAARLVVPPRTVVRGFARQGEVVTVEAAGPPNVRAVVRVFDLGGRLVKVLFDSRLPANGRHSLTWDARDESFELVPAGLYVCHLLVTDAQGHTSEARAPIVVAVRLRGGAR